MHFQKNQVCKIPPRGGTNVFLARGLLTVIFCLVFTAPANWRVELRAKIGHYRNRCLDGLESSVFDIIGLLDCEPVKITLRENPTPYCLTTARRLPFPLMSKVAAELDRLENEGIIQKVEHLTDRCGLISA